MISSKSIILAESQERWMLALQEAERSGICGLALPGNCICIADCLAPGDGIISDLAGLIENAKIKKVLYDAKTALSLLCASEKRTLAARNIFDHGRLQISCPPGLLRRRAFPYEM